MIKISMKAYLIYLHNAPIGYIQLYNVYNFISTLVTSGLPKNLATLDFFIGRKEHLGKS
ncbi:hypothetical protein ABSA28_01064 [Candidatus Hepatincolaceae symbiont of Richtersius coronifer]